MYARIKKMLPYQRRSQRRAEKQKHLLAVLVAIAKKKRQELEMAKTASSTSVAEVEVEKPAIINQEVLIMDTFVNSRETRYKMIINNDQKVSWELCERLEKRPNIHSSKISSICWKNIVLSFDSHAFVADETSECYNILTKKSFVIGHKFPNSFPNLKDFVLAELNDKLYMIGGRYYEDSTKQYVKSDRVFCRNLLSKECIWVEQKERLNHSRSNASVTTHQGKIVLAGGIDSNLEYLTSIEVFDPHMGIWQEEGNLARPGDFDAGVQVIMSINNNLYAIGSGYTKGMWIETRDEHTGKWLIIGSLQEGCGNRCGCAIVACETTIYFIGGGTSSMMMNNTNNESSWNSFNMDTCTWASETERYRSSFHRPLPGKFSRGGAICITTRD